MHRKWAVTLGTALAAVTLAVVPLTAFGDDGSGTTTTRQALAIVAPFGAPVGREVSMGVFTRATQDPVAGAGIWAINKDNLEALKQDISNLKNKAGATQSDYEAALNPRGGKIGVTGPNGTLTFAFPQPGTFVLVALKEGYFPGIAAITIVAGVKALSVEAPRRARPDEKVTITVTQKGAGPPVEGASVYALSRDEAAGLKESVTELARESATPLDDKDFEGIIRGHGNFIGKTDKDGKVDHSFKDTGIYVLVAVQKGFVPGWAPIAIMNPPRALDIKAVPQRAEVGKDVKMTVTERDGNAPVAGAAVWALSREEAQALKEAAAALQKDQSIAPDAKDYESLLAGRLLLGRTDSQGKLSYAFGAPGTYVLVTTHRGYIPGFTVVSIVEKPSADKGATASTDKPRTN